MGMSSEFTVNHLSGSTSDDMQGRRPSMPGMMIGYSATGIPGVSIPITIKPSNAVPSTKMSLITVITPCQIFVRVPFNSRHRAETVANLLGVLRLAHSDRILKTGGYEFDTLRWISSLPSEIAKYGSETMTDNDEALISCVADALLESITAGFAGHQCNASPFWRALVFNCFPSQFFFEAPDVWSRMDVQVLRDLVDGKELSDDAKELLPSEYIIMLRRTLTRRKFAVTMDDLYVVVLEEATIGDKVPSCDMGL
ncbi:hypothetical protein T440DRAFT_35107 [Plenodomus tracheiphilus IPT5]|uniref:Uncharacterized protein n=1 Tax=Plenodomus tracheiphilus IPT5 TaxID=1408161 RepID=A0A6A7AML6_9PLEO|nr:hypothetical protein T440DRAFT_35107 [Plenodomus tracheiphilus IPT5]